MMETKISVKMQRHRQKSTVVENASKEGQALYSGKKKKNIQIFPFWQKKSHDPESWSADWKNHLKEAREHLPVGGQLGESWQLPGTPWPVSVSSSGKCKYHWDQAG